jgi:uncharacterized RDD family membrane protein YckC
MSEKETETPIQQDMNQMAENAPQENLNSGTEMSKTQTKQELTSSNTENQQSAEADHPDDFFQQVLGSFKRNEYSEEEIQLRQKEWQRYEGQENETEGRKRVNDFPDYFFAGFWIRLFAYLVDVLCIGAVTGITLDTIYHLGGWSSSGHTFGLYQLLSLAIYLSYFVLLTKFNQGQTIGKMIFGIRVVSFTEAELSWKTVLIRELCMRYVLQFNLFFYLGYLPVIFTKEKQHAGDFFSETSVVTINLIKAFNKQVSADS